MKCTGCLNIEQENFPFFKEEEKVFIDMEDCGNDSLGNRIDNLEIKYCPVCGKKLYVTN